MAGVLEGKVISLVPLIQSAQLKSAYEMVSDTANIGRHSSNDVCLPLESVSRFHARLEKHPEGLRLADLGSSNGTYINQARVEEGALEDGDEVAFGNIALIVRIRSALEKDPTETAARSVRVQAPGAEGVHSVVRKSIRSDTTRYPVFEREITDADSLDRARKLLSALFRFHKELAHRTDEQEIFQSLLELIFEALPCDRGVILARQGEGGSFHPVRAKIREADADAEIAISQTIIDRCLRDQVAILSRDAMSDSRFDASDSILLHDIRSAMCAPLICRGHTLAICFVDASEERRAFAEADLEFFASLCAEVAILLDNARMYREMLTHERMAAIGQTVSGMAHNIKNILLLSQGGIDLMDACLERKNFAQVPETWGLIKRGLDRVNALAKEMLDFSRERECRKRPGNVNAVILETLELIREEFDNKGVKLNTRLDEAIPEHLIDREGFERALVNLLVNAAEAIEREDGHVDIVTALERDRIIRVLVADNGCGIPAEHLPYVFQPFYSTKGSKGTGLGLPMTRKFIESMGGRISCRSDEEAGTTFEITLRLERGDTVLK